MKRWVYLILILVRLFGQIALTPNTRSPKSPSNSDRPTPPTNPIAYSLKSNSDRPSTLTNRSPIPHIKQRSPLNTHKTRSLIPSNQTAIAPHHHKTDRLFPTANSDRHSQPTKPDRLNLNINQRSPLNTHKARSPKSQHQTAIFSSESGRREF
ncbi:MAG: hypothetical protein IM585_02295 [Pseudanabaena sp. M135S2SP2A07QC]|nr:hypothetical protein [Pseudanabaena sp. M090S1SP2A07QC]MCA6507604.1 hypothetical protein [Pseudanabaena sp. M172S2SP2A07QC]MCA6519957.1 hypothetical protein [Pseudanabaena sp. M110S1SP2A07QC]MCA6522737.1 hypothetical protein [Pseudanabaena sp. M051S1SP2A07QC]MCA6526586.1 hypothetical protein [Pseudanabaena sp. M179S2SP2A07QC]MCA6529867.1 hypothetical protein [Pseudanabaena sp. M125S2SP2A07QC]MCA6532652.1 hypothetical protein [Pseudanabaena sp. M176S2SP2A07QC]MCA6539852.1 hypothetical prot